MASFRGAPEIYTIVGVVRALDFVWYSAPGSDMDRGFLEKFE